MGLKISDFARINYDYKKLKQDIELLKLGVSYTSDELQKTNAELEVVSAVVEGEAENRGETTALSGWAHVPQLLESDRYPLVKTSEPGINVETQVLLRKLDII